MYKRLLAGSAEAPAAQCAFEQSAASAVCLQSGDTKRRLNDFFESRR